MIRIGLTGATGMIGTNLLTHLGNDETLRRRYHPVALVRSVSDTGRLREKGIETREVDYRDVGSFAGSLEDLEVVIHLAGLTKSYRKGEFYEVNTVGTRNLLAAISRHGAGVRHFLFSSSMAACGPAPSPDRPKDEKSECAPESRYGVSKLMAEEAVRASQLPWTILRLPVVLGPHDYEGLHLLRLVRGGWLFTFGRQEDYFSYVCAQDLARVIFRMVLNPAVFREVLNVCYDGSTRGTELYARVRGILGLDPSFRLHHLPRWCAFAVGFASNLVQRVRRKASYITLDKAKDLTGKNLVVTNEKLKRKLGMNRFEEAGALAETIRWFQERGLL